MYIGINEFPNIVQLVENKEENQYELSKMSLAKTGEILYQKNCSVCHGKGLKRNNFFPSLIDVEKRLNSVAVKEILEKPKGIMPLFASLPEADKKAII